MNEITKSGGPEIKNLIYEIRGKQVMLDSDLAELYQCANGTKDINKAVKRNPERFPDDFYFQLTKEEYADILRFQIGTSNLLF
ncbi:ORF6N domain-containing protein [Candidatus Saccharibacteria bacterium]|nr:ORF6N domain-containing protein [Candidatus Saccharibacteria bacterium]